MSGENLFTMLSSYRPGTSATPFTIYCAQGLAYLLKQGNHRLSELLAARAGLRERAIEGIDVQAPVPGGGFADLLLTFEGGRHLIVEVKVEFGVTGSDTTAAAADSMPAATQPSLVLALTGDERAGDTPSLSWDELVAALGGDDDALAAQYAEFIRRDVIGVGEVSLEEAITTNRLYALGAAALRRRFLRRVSYQSSASRPLNGRYRYIGTTFAVNGGEMSNWVGLVNEEVPLSEHYHLMLASKTAPLSQPVAQPRATGDWKWDHWTGLGRIVRPLTAREFDGLLARLSIPGDSQA